MGKETFQRRTHLPGTDPAILVMGVVEMPVEIRVREATPDDAEAVAELLQQLGYPNTPDSVRSRLDELSLKSDYRAFVAECGGQVAGVVGFHVIQFFERDGLWCRLTALVVGDRFRGRGVGRRLVEHVEAIATDLGCSQVELNSGEQRIGAHAFYSHLGYEQVSRRFRKLL